MSRRSSQRQRGVGRSADAALDSNDGGGPADDEGVEPKPVEAILGTRTFDTGLYDEDVLDERRPPYYRTGQTSDGYKRPRVAAVDRVPPTESVEDFIGDVNANKPVGRNPEVALVPTGDELRKYKSEFDDRKRNYEPPYLRVPVFHERVVGDAGLAARYEWAFGSGGSLGEPGYSYEVDIDYDAGEVTITAARVGESTE